jgi:citrate lyase subunit beta/citryl-CoA lyase
VSSPRSAGPGSPDVTPRRSVLYLPSSNRRALEKAKTIPADAIILDLEDAVAPDAKATARAQAVEALGSGEYGRRALLVRCNALDSPWGAEDLVAVARAGAGGVVVPKVSSRRELADVAAVLDKAGAPADLPLLPMIETPSAVLDARDIASFERVCCLVMGINDLAKELRAALVAGRAPLVPHLATALLAAREAGVAIVDGVYNDVTDLEGLEAECRQAADMGFDGKTLIHPGQVEVANRVWTPSEADLLQAQRVITAFDAARREGKAVVALDGRLIENLHVETARQTLAMAEAIAAVLVEGDPEGGSKKPVEVT